MMRHKSKRLAPNGRFNYKLSGYNSLYEFEKAQHTEGQVETFINFISSRKELLEAMKNKDFKTFAEGYNGTDNISNKYDKKLTKLYNMYKK